MARYQRVTWHHDFADEPAELYSEIDDAGVETRKVEVYRDGRFGYADRVRSTGTSMLSETEMPTLAEIAAQPEFTARSIAQTEFEKMWHQATTPTERPDR